MRVTCPDCGTVLDCFHPATGLVHPTPEFPTGSVDGYHLPPHAGRRRHWWQLFRPRCPRPVVWTHPAPHAPWRALEAGWNWPRVSSDNPLPEGDEMAILTFETHRRPDDPDQ